MQQRSGKNEDISRTIEKLAKIMFSPLPFLVRPCHGQTDDLIAYAVSKLRRVNEDDDDREDHGRHRGPIPAAAPVGS